jgi:glycosyltransferase involved in cell wall biosynthesis
MKPLSVAFDHQIFDFQRYGGVSRYFVETATELARQPACQVAIVAPLHMNEYLRAVQAPVHRTAFFVGGVPKSRRVARAVNTLLVPALLQNRKPDIVHRTYYEADQRPVKGARTVITVYDLIHERMGQSMAHDVHARDKRAAIAAADHAICISESTRRDLIELFGVDPQRTSVVHLGFSLMPGEAGAVPASPQRPFILYVGLRGKYKNFQGLLDAYAASSRLRDQFDIVCFGGGPFSANESAAIQTSGARAGSVVQRGGSDSVLQHLYRHAAVFVYPSLYEGFGIPPLEAMSFGCPVVCCPVASMPEVVGDAAAFFDPSDTDTLVSAIERATGDPAYRAQLVQSGTARLAHFSWQRCAAATLQVYRKLLA